MWPEATAGLVEVTPPAGEPVTLAEAKAHVRLETTFAADDAYLSALITAARQRVEMELSRCLLTTTFRLSLDGFPASGAPIEFPVSPVASVTSVAYLDRDGDTQTIDPADYALTEGRVPALLQPSAASDGWPEALAQYGAVLVTFVAGTAASAVPGPLRQAILLLAGHWYERRELVVTGRFGPMPLSAEWLMAPYDDGRY